VLLAKTLKSSTFALALVWVALFSGTVFGLLGYVYWATTDYVRSRYDRAISADRALLVQSNTRPGRDALVDLINRRIADGGFEGGIYLLADPSGTVLAGSLKSWPAALRAVQGWADFVAPEAAGHTMLRATFETLPDGSHLLVGRSLDDLDRFVRMIKTALAVGATLTFVLAAVAGVSVTPARDICYAGGCYHLNGDGVNVAYQWVWIPSAPSSPPPPPPPSSPPRP
jgi:hypothetical protein